MKERVQFLSLRKPASVGLIFRVYFGYIARETIEHKYITGLYIYIHALSRKKSTIGYITQDTYIYSQYTGKKKPNTQKQIHITHLNTPQ